MDHLTAFAEQNRALTDIVRAADPDGLVPTCPDWTLHRLAVHVGRGDRWAATIVRERATAPVDQRAVPDGSPPAGSEIADWLAAGPSLLAEAIASTGSDTPVWTFTGPQPAAWWTRRRLHESVVHRADAALAAGLPYRLDAPVAADGLSEWLTLLAARPAERGPAPLGEGESLHLHATDDDLGTTGEPGPAGEWMVRGVGGGLAWEPGHGKGTVALRGGAADLLLAVMRRIPANDQRVQVLGDDDVWRTWLERTPF